jgi:ribonuclease HI
MISVFSDGGADNKGRSGAACVIEGVEGRGPLGFVAFLGSATNNEAEIFSAIMGFAVGILLHESGPPTEIRWVSDSEYSLKSATQYMKSWLKNGWQTSQKKPVKNQGLWRSFNAITSGIRIIPEHVFGHTGHPQNEACDAAVTWIRMNDRTFSEGSTEIETPVCRNWMVIDGRALLKEIRDAEDSGVTCAFLNSFFSSYLPGLNHNDIEHRYSAAGSKKEPPHTSMPLEKTPMIQKLTRAYFKKLSEIDPGKTQEKNDPEFKKIIQALGKWQERG